MASKNVVYKTDGTDPLPGAGFTLYKHNGTGYDVVGSERTGVTTFEWKGLDVGKYKLSETTVPAGYNKADDVEFIITATVTDGTLTTLASDNAKVVATLADGLWTATVVNTSGSLMPETGGIGTTVFYTVGSLLAVGAGILLITKKRMSAEQ